MYSTRAKNRQSIVKNKQKSQRKLERQLSAPVLDLLPFPSALILYPMTPVFLPGPGKAISRSHTCSYINVTPSQSTQRACLWETSGPRRRLSCTALTQLQRTMGFQWASHIYFTGPTRRVSVFSSPWHMLYDHMNSSHLYSFSSDALSGPTSSETNHKDSLWRTDITLGTVLYAANISGMSDRLRRDLKQVIFAPCPENPQRTQTLRCCFEAVCVYRHPAWMQRMLCLACCYFQRKRKVSWIMNEFVITHSNR